MSRVLQTANCLRQQPEFSPLDKTRTFFLLGLTLLIFLFILASIFYISSHVKAVNIGYKINQELNQKQKLIEENKRLSLEIARLKSPTRIEREATQHLGLVSPAPGQVLYLSQIQQLNPETQVAAATPPQPQPQAPSTPKVQAKKPIKPSVPATTAEPKTAKKVLIAKIVGKGSLQNSPAKEKEVPKKSRESVPAVLLDTMP